MTPSPAASYKTIHDVEWAGKLAFMRLDLNVPLSIPHPQGERLIEDDTRIQEALPSIRAVLDHGARLVIASHLGRPDGKNQKALTLEPVARHLAHLLEQEVTFADDCVGDGIELLAQGLKKGQILLLENLRFHPEEETNDPAFAHRLAKLGETYITDAFGTLHRKHASTHAVPALMPTRAIGFLIEKELRFFEKLLNPAQRPFFALLGGAKVSDKLKTIESLLRRVDGLAIGGAMAHAFWLAQGKTLPDEARPVHSQDIVAATSVLREARRREIKILLPSNTEGAFDLGPQSIQEFQEYLSQARTLFWNGPMGWFEKEEYSVGTFAMARHIAGLSALKIVGGGDTVSAVKKAQVADQFDHLSTGGGAALEYLEGNGLPGLEILKTNSKRDQRLTFPTS